MRVSENKIIITIKFLILKLVDGKQYNSISCDVLKIALMSHTLVSTFSVRCRPSWPYEPGNQHDSEDADDMGTVLAIKWTLDPQIQLGRAAK